MSNELTMIERLQATRGQELLRINDLVNQPAKGRVGLLNISKSGWRRGVKEGRFPQPVKLGVRIPAWRRSDIEELLKNGIAQ